MDYAIKTKGYGDNGFNKVLVQNDIEYDAVRQNKGIFPQLKLTYLSGKPTWIDSLASTSATWTEKEFTFLTSNINTTHQGKKLIYFFPLCIQSSIK